MDISIINQVYLGSLIRSNYIQYFNNYDYRSLLNTTLFVDLSTKDDFCTLFNHKGIKIVYFTNINKQIMDMIDFLNRKIDNIIFATNNKFYYKKLKTIRINVIFINIYNCKFNLKAIYDYRIQNLKNYKILTNNKLSSIAENLKDNLHDIGYDAQIINSFSKDDELENDIYIIIYVKYFTELKNPLPNNYIFYQMEQEYSNMIDKNYIDMMNNSLKIFEFSESNTFYRNLINHNRVFYNPFPLCKQIYHTKPTTDILFYGQFNERRLNILKYLEGHFKINYYENVLESQRDELIQKCKIVLNLHYYDNACLETCRINEILKFNKYIVSEKGKDNDNDNMELYKKCVSFVDVINDDLSNINILIDKINCTLNNYDNLIKEMNIKEIYEFCKNKLKENLD